jgi:5'-phosphate synthase pdxT subunit
MVGVLGLQGDFDAHCKAMERAGAEACVVKKPAQLAALRGLIIPGGESTTLIRLMDLYGFWEALPQFAQEGKGIFGTCAGMILLAQDVENPRQKSLGLIDLSVERNSYGRQRESFETTGVFNYNGKFVEAPMVFIRAPRILRVGPKARPLAFRGEECVMAQQGKILVASFHPELTDSLMIHQYFLEMLQ